MEEQHDCTSTRRSEKSDVAMSESLKQFDDSYPSIGGPGVIRDHSGRHLEVENWREFGLLPSICSVNTKEETIIFLVSVAYILSQI